jgi:multiple sugar transport system permease protein
VIYSIATHLLVRLAWNRRGVLGVLIIILLSQLFWVVPAVLIVNPRGTPDDASSYALWFGNWIVSAFAIVLLGRTARTAPRQLQDSATLDGLGPFGTWRNATFPFTALDLVLIALLTVMATLIPYWGCITLPEAGNSIVIFQRFLSPSGRIALMTIVSVVGALPLFALFFLEHRRR